MRPGSQIAAIVEKELGSAIFCIDGVIVSVAGGVGVVQPVPKRQFDDNDEPVAYPVVENVRLISLVWDGGESGIDGRIKPGDGCVLWALSHGDGEAPDHKTLSNAVAICGFSDKARYPTPETSAGIRVFSGQSFIHIDNNIITADTGGGATVVMQADKITLNAPGGITSTAPMWTHNGDFTVNGNTLLNGALGQGAGAGGTADATFLGNVTINGQSVAADHVSGNKESSISGLHHFHIGNGAGSETSKPL